VRGQAGASVLVDRVFIGTIPLDVELPARSGTRAVVVRAPGYVEFSAAYAADAQQRLTIALVPRRVRRPSAPRPTAPAWDPESVRPPR
jgi:hypothetical protein